MNLYTIPTDTKRYLPYGSAHPKHCKTNIPFCLARRICTIVESEEAKEKHLRELKYIMHEKKYPLEVINKGIAKTRSIPQTKLRLAKDQEESGKILPFVTTYNQNNPSVFSTIKTTSQLLCDNNVPGMRDFKLRTFIGVETAALTFRTKQYSTSYSSHICYGKRFYNDFFLNHHTIALVNNFLKLLSCVVIETASDVMKKNQLS